MLVYAGMRALLAALLLTTAAWSTETPRHLRATIEQHSLSADQVQHYAGAYLRNVRDCYVATAQDVPAATGELTLQVMVMRSGDALVERVNAPGITGKRLGTLISCVAQEVNTWHFPIARNDTVAILPYVFHKTRGAGPQLSCWNPRGCRR